VELICDASDRLVREFTDANGEWSAEVPDGAVHVRASHVVGAGTFRLDVARPQDVPASIVIARRDLGARKPAADVDEPPDPAEVTGCVVDAAGRRIGDATVAIVGGGNRRTDARGEFRIDGGAAGREAELVVTANGYLPVRRRISVGTAPVRVALPARGSVIVRLRPPPGAAERGAPEFAWSAGAGPDEPLLESPQDRSLAADLGDRVRLVLPEGRNCLAFRVAPGEWVRFDGVDVRAGRDVELTYAFPAFGRLRATVRTRDGAAVSGAAVFVLSTGVAVAATDEQGRIDVRGPVADRGVPADTESLLVLHPGHAPRVTAPADLGRDAEFDVVLDSGVRVDGILVGANGAPVRAKVAWLPRGGAPAMTTEAGADGRFEFACPLPDGPQRFWVRLEDEEARVVEAPVPAGESASVRLELR
jgi:hypothetical protein